MINVQELGVMGDGLTDDTPALQRALNGADSLYFPPGVYCCNGLTIPSNRTLYSDSDASLLLDFPSGSQPTAHSPQPNQAITLVGSNITVRNLTFQGKASRWAAFIDLDRDNLSDITFDGCRFLDLHRPIRVRAEAINNRFLRNFTVRNCLFKNTVDRAIDFLVSMPLGGKGYTLENVCIDNNRFEDIAPNTSGKGGESGNFDAAIYIGSLRSVKGFYLRNNIVNRAAPQFLAMSLSPNLRQDFVISGNTIHQEGTEVVVNMCYTLSNIDNLVYDRNFCYGVDFEHVVLRNCRNFKVTNSHFEKANVGIAIHDVTPVEHSCGSIIGCTFQDVECPSTENNGNKAIFVVSDTADINVSNCRYRKHSGAKDQVGIEINYRTTRKAPSPRLGIHVTGCTFEDMVGITIKSGGHANYPGHARIASCTFRRCPQAINFTYPMGNVVYACSFESCDTDIKSRSGTTSLRAAFNLHMNTNPNNLEGAGAHVVELRSTATFYVVEGSIFRNVKGIFVVATGELNPAMHQLAWSNNSADAQSTGVPPLQARA